MPDLNDGDGRVGVSFSGDGLVATILVDREAKLNALTLSMLAQLEHVCREVDSSRARVVVVRSAGSRVFCVGADINHFSGLNSVEMLRRWVAEGHRAFDALARLRQPTIAIVDGLALGGGFELALACDFRIVTAEAAFGLPEVGLGTVPGWGGTERLTDLVGRSRAKEVVLTRRQLNCAESASWGLVTLLVSRGALDAELELFVGQLLGSAPVAAQLAKRIIDAAADGAASSTLEALASGLAVSTADHREGLAAFREKRTPTFIDA